MCPEFKDPDLVKFWVEKAEEYPYLFWIHAMATLKFEIDKEYAKLSQQLIHSDREVIVPKTSEKFAELAEARRDIYFLLSEGYKAPTVKLAKKIIDKSFVNALRNAIEIATKNGAPLNSTGLENINSFAKKFEKIDLQNFQIKLNEEHTAIFYDVVFPIVSPYESIYRSEKQTMAEPAGEVERKYEKAGLAISKRFTELPDHATLELEFMYHLCKGEADAWRRGEKDRALKFLEMQKEFLYEHLMWINYLSNDVLETAERKAVADFYRGIAKVIKEILVLEYGQISKLIDATGKVELDKIPFFEKLRRTFRRLVFSLSKQDENLFLIPIESIWSKLLKKIRMS